MFMQSSRDSSIWRSLAVAFGDGVAFGVGVKLAQGANRPADSAPAPAAAPVLNAVTGRLEQIEQRLFSIEKTPPLVAAPEPAPFDQKVLEAVVNALDARLKEQAGQVERRITELEAKLAIDLKALERQDSAIGARLQKRLEEVHGEYNEHVTAIRDAVAQDMDILYSQVAKTREESAETARETVKAGLHEVLGPSLEERIAAAVTQLVSGQIESHVQSLEDRMHVHVLEAAERAGLAATVQTTRLDEEMAAVRAALAEKDHEIADLRQRITDADQSVLDLILAMGQMCRQVAERISGPALIAESEPVNRSTPGGEPPADAAPPTATLSAPEAKEAPPAVDAPPSDSFAALPEPVAVAFAPGNGLNGHANIEPLPPAQAEDAVPGFASGERSSRLWRIPLVSSLLILAAGSLHLLR